METNQFLIFKTGGQLYGIEVEMIAGVEEPDNIKLFQHSLANVVGMLPLRDKEIPVYSLRKKFSLDDNWDIKQGKIIVSVDNTYGFTADDILSVAMIKDEETEPVPAVVINDKTEYIKGFATAEDGLITLINATKLIDEEEKEVIEELNRA